MTQVADDPLEAGREAAARGAYADAYELLRGVGQLTGEDLEHLAEAAYWTGRLDEAIETRERAYTAHLDAGAKAEATRVALRIAADYFGKGSLNISSGWSSKAERLLEGQPESVANGYLAFMKAVTGMLEGLVEDAIAEVGRALELARTHEDRNLEAMALVVKGRSLVLSGDADSGLKLLDEATSSAVSGELEPFATGFVYCITITSCHGVGDLGRAAEWTEAAARWCDRKDISGFPGACRVHHASITRLRGEWDEAEKQAQMACDELQGFDTWTTAAGFYEIGEIHRRRGEFADADAAYDRAKEWGRPPQPGRALLRLAQGKVDEAAKAIRRSLASSGDPIARISRLPAAVEIYLQADSGEEAREAGEELERLVDGFRIGDERTPAFDATVCLAWGQIELDDENVEKAIERLERAVEIWQQIKAPYEVAQARMQLGVALLRLGEEESAREEVKAARSTFERLGAMLDLQRAKGLLGEPDARRTFMFTDIVDSTKLAEALGDERWKKVLAWHDRELGKLIEAEGGDVLKQTGDGYFAAFPSPASAIQAAVAIQRAIDASEAVTPDVRIGIHTGGAFHRADKDYAGQGVNVAARIGALAGGGEILVSRESLNGSPFPLSPVRKEDLKGIDRPVELVAVEWR
jgi:class 3 adenylate cyclase